MNQQKSKPSNPPPTVQTANHDPQKRPDSSTVVPGASRITADEAEPVLAKHQQPPLPGIDSYFPPPLELDNSSKSLTETSRHLLDQWEKERASSVGACINIFPSGEITGGFYNTGRKAPPERKGKTISQEFTRKARKTIRRAVESGVAEFKVFVTLTFDPKSAQLNDSGQVDQAWAKMEFKRFLNTIKKFYDRRGAAHE